MPIPTTFRINQNKLSPFSGEELSTLPHQQQVLERALLQRNYIARTVKALSRLSGLSADDVIEYCERSAHIGRSPMEDAVGNTYYGILTRLKKKYKIGPAGNLTEDYGESIQLDSDLQLKTVFISHGQNETLKLKVKDFLVSRLGLNTIILSERPNEGLTIIEKLEKYSRLCGCALVLLTKDDLMASGDNRARQNVVHELGFFHGKFGRKRVVLLKQLGVELFSNIGGIVYVEFPEGSIEAIYENLRYELTTMGMQIKDQP